MDGRISFKRKQLLRRSVLLQATACGSVISSLCAWEQIQKLFNRKAGLCDIPCIAGGGGEAQENTKNKNQWNLKFHIWSRLWSILLIFDKLFFSWGTKNYVGWIWVEILYLVSYTQRRKEQAVSPKWDFCNKMLWAFHVLPVSRPVVCLMKYIYIAYRCTLKL